jgi:NADH dehydrogenase
VVPVSGSGKARFQPIWAADVARCVARWLQEPRAGRLELVGPDVLDYDQMSDLVSRAAGRPRPLVHLPLPLVRYGLLAARSIAGESVFATWEEAELMEVPMVSERGTADAEALGVEPRRMRDVLEDT